MPDTTTTDLIDKAQALGEALKQHEAATKLESAIAKLEKDSDAQNALKAYNQALNAVARKQYSGQPIEVSDKQALESAQTALIHNITLKSFQMAQVEYVDLMRKIDDAVYADSPLNVTQEGRGGDQGNGGGPAGGSPLVGM